MEGDVMSKVLGSWSGMRKYLKQKMSDSVGIFLFPYIGSCFLPAGPSPKGFITN